MIYFESLCLYQTSVFDWPDLLQVVGLGHEAMSPVFYVFRAGSLTVLRFVVAHEGTRPAI